MSYTYSVFFFRLLLCLPRFAVWDRFGSIVHRPRRYSLFNVNFHSAFFPSLLNSVICLYCGHHKNDRSIKSHYIWSSPSIFCCCFCYCCCVSFHYFCVHRRLWQMQFINKKKGQQKKKTNENNTKKKKKKRCSLQLMLMRYGCDIYPDPRPVPRVCVAHCPWMSPCESDTHRTPPDMVSQIFVWGHSKLRCPKSPAVTFFRVKNM